MPEVKTNTALQELIDFGWENLDTTPLTIIRFAEGLLEKEKQQLLHAFKAGYIKCEETKLHPNL